MERYGDNPEADRKLLKVNGLGAAEVRLKLFFTEFVILITVRVFCLPSEHLSVDMRGSWIFYLSFGVI